MSFLRESAADASLLDVFKRFPGFARPLLALHEQLLRGDDSPLSIAQREMIAAYVSRLNACSYCHGIHRFTAEAFGIDQELLKKAVDDLDTAPLEPAFAVLLGYVRKVTEQPSRITDEDVATVFEAGWSDRALHDAVAVAALFNMMNRFVDGLGIEVDASYLPFSGKRLAEGGYLGLEDHLDA